MTDESSNPTDASAAGTAEPTVAFCQQCGRGLTATTQRRVGSGTFCQPCAALYAVPASGPAQAPAGAYTPVNAAPGHLGSLPPAVGDPNPVLAGFLGLIPGVGAMYNGQYPKGVIHLVIFVVLTSLADNLNWVLWWFVWGWIFYQAFEAYHTAQARRDGLSLPDPFGWNELGERLGFSRADTSSTPRPASPRTAGDGAGQTSPSQAHESQAGTSHPSSAPFTSPFPAAAAAPPADVPPAYAPMAGVAGSAPPPANSAFASSAASSSWTGVPPVPAFSSTYTGVPPISSGVAPPVGPPLAVARAQRFPAGAAWLIALGLLFLLANMAPAWRLEGRWLIPALLALLAVWTGSRRILAAEALRSSSFPGTSRLAWAETLLGPALLFTVAVLLALQTGRVVTLRHSWPAFLIVWGVLLLVGRAQPFLPGPNMNPAATGGSPAPGSAEDALPR